MPSRLCEGHIVATQTVTYVPALSGIFMGNTGIVDPAKNVCLVNISNSDALRKQLKNVTPKFSGMVRSMGGARISLVLDTATKKTDGTITPGKMLDVTGNKIRSINADGTGLQQLTHSGKSISNARWYAGGTEIMYLQDGQIWLAKIKGKDGSLRLATGKAVKLSDIPEGISEFKLSPDETMVMFVSTVQSALKKPSDLYPDIDKSSAISADDLMYRHWDHWVEKVPHTFICSLVPGKDGKAGKKSGN